MGGQKEGGVWAEIVRVRADLEDLEGGFSTLDCSISRRKKGVTVDRKGSLNDGIWNWRCDWVRPPKGRAFDEVENLKGLLSMVNLQQNHSDT
uniref:Uncharacterized protein n=1 Tax=Tanacetum cinerariifolium TaxID=118510 RepID=A0A6L2K199_TANCI|nr:hypothetical protein [Tanacetum cinerariifolium]